MKSIVWAIINLWFLPQFRSIVLHFERSVSFRYNYILVTASKKFKTKVADQLRQVDLKIEELQLALVNATCVKFQNKVEATMLPGVECLSQGNLPADKMSTLFKAMEEVRTFIAIPKATLAKVLGEKRQAEFDSLMNDVKGFFASLKNAVPMLVSMWTSTDFQPTSLVGQDLLNFLEYMSNDQSMQHVRKMLPKIVPLLGPFKSSIQEGAKKVISSATKSIASFLAKLQKTDVKLADLLTEELVGKTEDDGEENTKDVIKIPYGQIFKRYFEDLPSGKRGINVPLESEDDGTKLLSAGVLCQGAAVFPLAKNMAQLSGTLNKLKGQKTFAEKLPASVGPKSNELLVDSKLPFLTSEVALKVKLCLKALGDASSNVELIQIEKSVFSTIGMTFLAQAKEHLLSIIKDIVNETNTEFGNIKAHVINLLSAALTEFKLTEVNTSDAFEPSLVSKACQDNRFHQLYTMCLVGKNALVDSRAMLKNLSESCKSSFANDCTSAVQWAEAGIADFSSFLDGGVEKQNTLNFVGCAVGTVTLVQSLTRDLNTGETRQTLVHRSLQATKRLGVPLNKAIVSKCESIISGKPSK